MSRHCLVGLDVGTTKICAIVAEIDSSGQVHIVGFGQSPSQGIRKGVVIDIDSAAEAIKTCIKQARDTSGYEINRVIVGVTGEHIASLNSRGVVAITHPNREICESDVERVQDQSRVIVLPPDREIVHAIPRSYSVDGQSGVRSPVGMCGTRLEVETHVVTGAVSFLQNVVKCVQKAGLAVESTVLQPIATAEAILLPDERNLGVVVADIGGGTTDIAIFADGDIVYSSAIAVGGSHVTRDISIGLRTAVEEAERIKVAYGAVRIDDDSNPETFAVTNLGSDSPVDLDKQRLVEIIEPRMHELFSLIKKEILKSGHYNLLPAGIVLSGGGSLFYGSTDLCNAVTGMHTRIGAPNAVPGLPDPIKAPQHATAVGLVLYGSRSHRRAEQAARDGSLLGRLHRWLNRHAGIGH